MYHLSLIFIRAQFEESTTTSWLRAENLDLYRSTSISNFSRGGLNSVSQVYLAYFKPASIHECKVIPSECNCSFS